MYDFFDPTSHDYLFEAPDRDDELAPRLDGFHHIDAPRPVVPTGWADERQLPFDEEDLEQGWKTAQSAQLIAAVFGELFDAPNPDYHTIARAAHRWQQSLFNDWYSRRRVHAKIQDARELLADAGDQDPGDPEMRDAYLILQEMVRAHESRLEEFRVARQRLQGVLDAAKKGISGKPTRWWPTRRGLNLSASAPSDKAEETGRWYEARGWDGSAWQVRKVGEEVEAIRLDDGTTRKLTPKQAKRTLKVVALAA